MQLSTWNDTNQHWIPQFLLKGFGRKGRASEVYQIDKESGTISVSRVAEVASKERLLTEQDDHLMRDIEDRSARVVDRIRKGKLSFGEEGRQALDALVWAMMLNDPYKGFNDEATRETVVGDVSRDFAEAIRRYGGRVDTQDVKDVLDEQLSHDYLSWGSVNQDNTVRKALRLMGLSIFQAVDGEYFAIGDSPVLVVRGSVNGATSLMNPGSQVILPINSRNVLVYDWTTAVNLIRHGGVLDQGQVRSLNEDYYCGVQCRYVYGRSREHLARCRFLQLRRTPRERSLEVNDGWHLMRMNMLEAQALKDATNSMRKKAVGHEALELVSMAMAEAGENKNTDTV